MNESFYSIVLDKKVDFIRFYEFDVVEVVYKDESVSLIKQSIDGTWIFVEPPEDSLPEYYP